LSSTVDPSSGFNSSMRTHNPPYKSKKKNWSDKDACVHKRIHKPTLTYIVKCNPGQTFSVAFRPPDLDQLFGGLLSSGWASGANRKFVNCWSNRTRKNDASWYANYKSDDEISHSSFHGGGEVIRWKGAYLLAKANSRTSVKRTENIRIWRQVLV